MKIVHWTAFNRSGMNRVAESLHAAERAAGLDSHLCNCQEPPADNYESILDADIHVTHTHFPDDVRRRLTNKSYKWLWIGHGTPEHTFAHSVEDGLRGGYGHGDSWMLMQYALQHCDAAVVFWPRHHDIFKTLVDKRTQLHHIPLGVDKTFWSPGPSRGRYSGSPSLFTAENCHQIKWPLDLFMLWPWVYPKVSGSPVLHAAYLPTDQHRWFFPLINRNGASYGMHVTNGAFQHEDLRNVFRSVDYYIGLVRYGDFNRISLEANACGTKTISYRGNPYSDFWVTEGDQRIIAEELIEILSGRVPPRDKTSVPDVTETSKALVAVYASL
jgi:hypothetical protein